MPRPEEPKYPMLELNADKHCEWDAIRGFFAWLRWEHGLVLARRDKHHGDRLVPAHVVLDELIADFLGIDLKQLEEERRALLEKLANR